MSAVTEGAKPYYFVPAPSRHPASVAFGMLLIIFGASQWVNGAHWGSWVVLVGFAVWVFVMQQWFRQAISESEAGQYNKRVDVSFRWSMSWFIFSG
jgi:cytochrome c oxidase subunit 3